MPLDIDGADRSSLPAIRCTVALYERPGTWRSSFRDQFESHCPNLVVEALGAGLVFSKVDPEGVWGNQAFPRRFGPSRAFRGLQALQGPASEAFRGLSRHPSF